MKKSIQVYRNSSVHIRIDRGYRDLLKIKAAKSGKSIKELIEAYVIEILAAEEKK